MSAVGRMGVQDAPMSVEEFLESVQVGFNKYADVLRSEGFDDPQNYAFLDDEDFEQLREALINDECPHYHAKLILKGMLNLQAKLTGVPLGQRVAGEGR